VGTGLLNNSGALTVDFDTWANATTTTGFSTTSANHYVNSSTTIPKIYTENNFSLLQTLTSGLLSLASSTLQNFTAINATTSQATTTNLSATTATTTNLYGGFLTVTGGATSTFAGGITHTSGTVNIPTGQQYEINDVGVLSNTTLGSSVVNSTLTSLGTLTSLAVSGNTNIANATSTSFYSPVISGTTGTFTFLTATSTTQASTFPYASTTALSASGLIQGGNLLITGSSTLQNFSAILATTTEATSTNFASVTATTTNLYSGFLTVTGQATTTFAGGIAVANGTVNIPTGQQFAINNVAVLSADTLGSGVVYSSLTSLGTLTSLNVNGNATTSYATSTNSFYSPLITGNRGVFDYLVATSTNATSTFAGFLGVGTTTPWGNGLLTVGVDSPMLYVDKTSGFVGIGTSSPMSQLSVVGNIAVSGCAQAATSSYNITPENDCADLAESYPAGEVLTPGDVVTIAGNSPFRLMKATRESGALLGVVSTHPAVVFEGDVASFGSPRTKDSYGVNDKTPLALVGRIPVKVNMEGGVIRTGDYVTTSSEAGLAMKATRSGNVIGIALEDYSGTAGESNQILVFAKAGYQVIGDNSSMISSLPQEINDQIMAAVQAWFATIKEMTLDKLTAAIGTFNKLQLKDEATGEIYCVRMVNGDMRKDLGECTGSQISSPSSSSAPVIPVSDTPTSTPEAITPPPSETSTSTPDVASSTPML
jgi:hypothetical protein